MQKKREAKQEKRKATKDEKKAKKKQHSMKSHDLSIADFTDSEEEKGKEGDWELDEKCNTSRLINSNEISCQSDSTRPSPY